MSDEQRDAIRKMLLLAIRDASEERWAAGWMRDIERELWLEGGDWRLVGELVGWPGDYPPEENWITAEEADRRWLAPGDATRFDGHASQSAVHEPGWLSAEFDRARARSADVPPHARPVVTRPMARGHADD